MSCLAWDGKVLAADRRALLGSLYRTTQKIFRVDTATRGPALCGYAGDSDKGEELLAWFDAGYIPDKFPPSQRSAENWTSLMVVWQDGTIWRFERGPHPVKFPPQQFAMGSGRDFALAAMHCGRTAIDAVEVAIALDSGCGNGVDALTFEDTNASHL